MSKIRIRISKEHPEIAKYLDKEGRYDPYKSELIRDTYKEERVLLHNKFNENASNLFDKIFNKK
jgi:hypothetical protein